MRLAHENSGDDFERPRPPSPIARAFSLLLGGLFLAGCGAGAGSEASPPAPSAPEEAEAEAGDEAGVAETPEDAELERADRVREVRFAQDPIVVETGSSVTMEELDPTLLDGDGHQVEDVPFFLVPLDGPVAAFRDGAIVGLEEGETELTTAVLAPGADGNPEPRTFTVNIRVVGPAVAELSIDEPEATVYAGTSIPLDVTALAEDGTERRRVSVEWTSRDADVGTVAPGGHFRAHQPGSATVVAEVEGVRAERVIQVQASPVQRVELSPGSAAVRTGDVVHFRATARDGEGTSVDDVPITFSVAGSSKRADLGAAVYADGAFVAERPGDYRVVAHVTGASAEAVIQVRPREVGRSVEQVGQGIISHTSTSDFWVFEGRDGRDYAYTGTHAGGQKMFAWDVTDPAGPVLTDSVVVDARVVNDVKVNQDATLAVITREGASDRRNGIVLLDLEDPAHPQVLGTYTEGLTGGVHNTFIEGDLVYAVHNGTLDVHIIDVSDPAEPREVGRWGIDRPGKYLHDFWVVDGIGYASYWDDGVWILDVGDGRWGGTPTDPQVISSYAYPEGHTHVALPYTNAEGNRYLFVGDEIFGCEECISRGGPHLQGPRGFVHVIDLADLENPEEVGRYEVPEAGVHNLWADDDKLYVAYYQAGLRVVDISGDLRGDLYSQGREIAWFPTGSPDGYVPNAPMAWSPQVHKGRVFVSDMNSGLWVLRLGPEDGDRPVP